MMRDATAGTAGTAKAANAASTARGRHQRMWIEERELQVGELRPGMYVSRLDRDWLGTPYMLEGFLIENPADIAELAKYCASVTVDVAKSETFVHAALRKPAAAPMVTADPPPPPAPRRKPYVIPDLAALRANPRPILARVQDEVPRASEALEAVDRAAGGIISELRNGGRLDVEAVEEAVTPVVDSIVRNPDAFFWLETLRHHDGYTYSHAVNCCGFMAAFGRHLGFPDEALHDLATAGLLLDIGKTALPEALLEHDGELEPAQLELLRSHLGHSLRLYDASGASNAVVREMILTHHEREDGSGYPAGLTGAQIPLFGRIAAIVDSFDAMTSLRPYREPLSRYEAMQALYKQRGTAYQPDLVEQFVQCLGVYPTGSLVELSTGEVAIVVAQNPVRRLFPEVMLLTDADKQRRESFAPLDLRETWSAHDNRQISIRKGLKPGSYGLDPKELYL
ncbi:HD-GYP domain-containing protein [Pseudoxanthomonas winnipegensis]|uniref:HD-GYP domain-containing protein n=2 Tax=Lysobacteraceae TaxID=32033 RepID=A0A4Q8LH16_9GAMM|nr:HD-GYP domain-containing protein [Pseudoxanthomonas winnipegensis]TMN24947.1 HD-GYP domain-containing protein [Pseudoxanthomonas sp. X-1]